MSAAPPISSSRSWALLAIVPAAVVAALQAAWPWPFFSDDAFISLRYAERLLHGLGLTWTDGDRVEGYSNLLWVLGCAGLGALGIDLVTAARALGALCTAGALWFLADATRPVDARTSALAAVAPLLVATSCTVLAWTLGGLEGPMMLLWLAWGFSQLGAALTRQPRVEAWTAAQLVRLGLPFALACLSRPDSPLWAAGAGLTLGLGAARGGARAAFAQTAWFALLPAGAVLAQTAFRLAYHGDLVPNTAHVKAEFDPGAGGAGLSYVGNALVALPGLVWPAMAGGAVLLWNRATRPLACVFAVPTILWLAYLAAIGGDHFPGRRLLHGALAPMALLGAFACRHLGASWARAAAALAIALALAALGLQTSRRDPQCLEVRAETWEWRGKALGTTLQRAFGGQGPRLAVDAAGAVPFYSRLPALDMLGLCDRTIATTPFPDWLRQVKARGDVPLPPGHLRGNGRYVMDQAPDLLLFGPPPGLPLPVFVSALEFEDDPRFLHGYRCVLVDTGPLEILPGVTESLVAPLWILLHGKVGVRSTPDRVEIPAWLFGSYAMPRPLMMRRLPPAPGTSEANAIARGLEALTQWFYARTAVATPHEHGPLELDLRAGEATFAWRLPAGRWRLAVEPAGAGVIAAPEAFAVDTERTVEMTLARAADATVQARVRRVVLTRQP